MLTKSQIGFMQGRLSTVPVGVYQRYPESYSKELSVAAASGFLKVEWIIDSYSRSFNPLLNPELFPSLSDSLRLNGVSVSSICADILLDSFSDLSAQITEWTSLLKTIISSASTLNIPVIVIPIIEHLSVSHNNDYNFLFSALDSVYELCHNSGIKLALELDLPPAEVRTLLSQTDTSVVGINYDIGNSAALGYPIREELDAYSHHILDIHIKDRLLGGPPVLLGSGNADLPYLAQYLLSSKYSNVITLQAFRLPHDFNLTLIQRDWFFSLYESFIYV